MVDVDASRYLLCLRTFADLQRIPKLGKHVSRRGFNAHVPLSLSRGSATFAGVLGSIRCCAQQSTPLFSWNHGTFFVESLERGCCAGRFVQLLQQLEFCSGALEKTCARGSCVRSRHDDGSSCLRPQIGDAAKKLGDASYDFAKEVDWNNGIFLQAPGKFQPLQALKAIDKMIDMGAAADPKLLKAAAEAHHKAIGSISGPNGVTSRADWDAVNAALGRVVASVPKAKVMDVYNAVKDITDPAVPGYMKSLVNGADAEKAYKGFLEFKDVVEKSIGVDSDLFLIILAFPRRSASAVLVFLASF